MTLTQCYSTAARLSQLGWDCLPDDDEADGVGARQAMGVNLTSFWNPGSTMPRLSINPPRTAPR